MLQGTSLMIFLSTVMMTTIPCFGFSPERSGNVRVTENVISTLGVGQKVTLDHATSAEAEITSVDKGLQITGAKSTRAVEQMSPADVTREGKLDFTSENVEIGARLSKIKDASTMKETTSIDVFTSAPKNIVIAITKPSQDRDDILKSIKASHPFAAEGTLQSCNCSQVEGTRYSLDDPLNTGSKMRKQDCEHFLRSNIASLLMWARDVKGMTTELVGISKDFDEIDEYNMKPTIQKLKPEIRGDWRTIDLGKPVNNEFLPFSNSQEEDDAAWKVFDMFSKVKWALFRSLLESLSGNVAATEESTPSRKLRALPSNLVDTIEELKSVENENGFILVAWVPAIESNSALELLQREATQDTLLVVTRVCSHDTKTVPFFAQGPSANMLREATTIWDVPDVIRNIIASGCQDSNCRSRRHDVFPPSIPAMNRNRHNIVTLRRSARDIAKKTDYMKGDDVPAVKEEAKNVEDLISKNEAAKDADKGVKAKAEINRDKDVNEKAEIHADEDAKAKEERDGGKDAKAKEERDGGKDAKAKEERDGGKDAMAKAEINGDKDVKAKTQKDEVEDAMAKAEINGDKDVKAKEERDGSNNVMPKTQRDEGKDVMAKTQKDEVEDAMAKAEINGDKDVKAKTQRDGGKDVMAKAEINGDQDVKAKEERDGSKDVMAKTQRDEGKIVMAKTQKDEVEDAMAKAEINGDKDVKAETQRDGGKDVMAKAEINGDKDVKEKTQRDGGKDVMAKAEINGDKDVKAKEETDGGKYVKAKAEINRDKDVKPKAEKNGSGSFKVAEKFTSIFSTVISMAVAFTLTL